MASMGSLAVDLEVLAHAETRRSGERLPIREIRGSDKSRVPSHQPTTTQG